eukprot:gene13490-15894_t
MAIMKNGIMGGFSGKVGTVVGYKLKGKDVMRGKPQKRKGKPSPKEQDNREKFGYVQLWLKPLTDFLRVGFNNYHPNYQGFVAAKSYQLTHVVKKVEEKYFIDPAQALVSFGSLSPAIEASVLAEKPASLTFNWKGGKYHYDERTMILVYDIANERAYHDTAAVRRSTGTYVLELTKSYSGKEVHVYLAFVSDDRKNQSNSQYLGAVTVL